MGAWIETVCGCAPATSAHVAPFVGAWIETLAVTNTTAPDKSHPSWVRGLKQAEKIASPYIILSHPSWVRGLKQPDGRGH